VIVGPNGSGKAILLNCRVGWTLVLRVLASPIILANTVFTTDLRVAKRVKPLLLITAISSVATLTVAYVLLPTTGTPAGTAHAGLRASPPRQTRRLPRRRLVRELADREGPPLPFAGVLAERPFVPVRLREELPRRLRPDPASQIQGPQSNPR
jgi:hypothetical protein